MQNESSPGHWFLTQNPMIFQGWKKSERYFEGWYFKIVDPTKKLALAFIPGISRDDNGTSHSFIQVLDGIRCKSYYFTYEAEKFQAKSRQLHLEVGGHIFSEKGLSLNEGHVKAELSFGSWSKLPKGFLRPGIMGWYSYMPFMQCYHGIGSAIHRIKGSITIEGRHVKLQNAIGYVEKDWGTSFPKSWIWTQCNTFANHNELSVFASVAHIPWMGSYFIGFLATLYYDGEWIIMATYNRSKKFVELREDGVLLEFTRGDKHIRLDVKKAKGAVLRSPLSGDMRGKVNESLQAEMELTFTDQGKVVVTDRGFFSGLEIAGPVEVLLDSK